ncbi:MAG: hypothetical protein P8J87_10590 [Verrucomicrobiales bacterium]|nr:hypothetical protein [Verrucomicrobiales bacterium]
MVDVAFPPDSEGGHIMEAHHLPFGEHVNSIAQTKVLTKAPIDVATELTMNFEATPESFFAKLFKKAKAKAFLKSYQVPLGATAKKKAVKKKKAK